MAQYINGEECTRIGLKTRNTVEDFTINKLTYSFGTRYNIGTTASGSTIHWIDPTYTFIVPKKMNVSSGESISFIGAEVTSKNISLGGASLGTNATLVFTNSTGTSETIYTVKINTSRLTISDDNIYLKSISGRFNDPKRIKFFEQVKYPILVDGVLYSSANDVPTMNSSNKTWIFYGEYQSEIYSDGDSTVINNIDGSLHLYGKLIIPESMNIISLSLPLANDVVFPKDITSLPSNCIKNNRFMSSLVIPENVEVIPSSFVQNDSNLSDIIFKSKSVRYLGATGGTVNSNIDAYLPFIGTPWYDKILNEQHGIAIPEGNTINSYGNYLITFPDNVTEIVEGDIYNKCSVISSGAAGKHGSYNSVKLLKAYIDNEYVCDFGFYGCQFKNGLSFNASENSRLKHIETWAIGNAMSEGFGNNITELHFGDSLIYVSNGNFVGKSSTEDIAITSIVFGSNPSEGTAQISAIAAAFYNMKNLQSVTIGANTPPNLTSTLAFSGCPALEHIYVPAGSVDLYKTATNWVAFADKITAIE